MSDEMENTTNPEAGEAAPAGETTPETPSTEGTPEADRDPVTGEAKTEEATTAPEGEAAAE